AAAPEAHADRAARPRPAGVGALPGLRGGARALRPAVIPPDRGHPRRLCSAVDGVAVGRAQGRCRGARRPGARSAHRPRNANGGVSRSSRPALRGRGRSAPGLGVDALLMGVVLTWNVAGRVALQEGQIQAVLGHGADVLCLQEVTPRTAPRWAEALAEGGYGVQLGRWPADPKGLRRLAVLTAAHGAPAVVPSPVLPWPERHLACMVSLDGMQVEIHNVHAPLSQKV